MTGTDTWFVRCAAFVTFIVMSMTVGTTLVGNAQILTIAEWVDKWKAAQQSARPTELKDLISELETHRVEGRYAKTGPIDYMIATSYCRLADGVSHASGRRYLRWILDNYNIGPDRTKVENDLVHCGPGFELASETTIALILPGLAGSAGVESKLYYVGGRGIEPVSTDPITVVDEIDPAEFAKRRFPLANLEDAIAEARNRLGVSNVVGDGRVVVASLSGHSNETLVKMAERMNNYLEFYRSEFDLRLPDDLVTVYIVPNSHALRGFAKKYHGIQVTQFNIGYAFRDDLSIVAAIRRQSNATGTIMHELFHATVRDRYGDIPPWLEEGLASLYEVSRIESERPVRIAGVPNWRGCVFLRLWLDREGLADAVSPPPLEKLVRMDWREFNVIDPDGNTAPVGHEAREHAVAQQAVNHATARYFMLYLQERGLLRDLFLKIAHRNPLTVGDDPKENAARQVRTVLGLDPDSDRALPDFTPEFFDWLRRNAPRQRDCP